ncbi:MULTISPECIES: NAD(P)-dependent oxidoreductase [Haloferax]|uniref:SDR family NAD(P)-dependent oxidoreductase n=1 Tax=Haloferax marinum TaxID=2666143 RepID=A0A6A8G3Z0_9EURY|nr:MULTISPECIES: NAD(P)-dependent oxidoreductase [Haloferax]KAB1196460.1 NAD(P)-dependent oxidoreductase [Haloferax sp. CBA1150]MRW95457.1 SDR family NAD(P)-dependent oxidoreductase [Haloferax marinum]
MAIDDVDFEGRTAFITGTSRGIGKQIALDLADRGANVVSTGKTVEEKDTLPGTIVETTEEIRERGGNSIWCQLDVRDDETIQAAIDETVDTFGGIDFVVNNAGAIHIANFENTPPKRFDLLMDVNARGSYATTHAALPHLRESDHAHVVTFSPPMPARPAPGKVAYALSKYGMTFIAESLAQELATDDIAVNALWPVAAIESEATRHFGMGRPEDWRTPQIMCDALTELFSRDPTECTGNTYYDEEILAEAGIEDLSSYAVVEGTDPGPMSAQLFDPDYER